jgi:glycosyltransferase involved in cell wall biosynthesis
VPAYNQNTIDDFFCRIDVLLFPTQVKESYGLTVREAILRNVWVITTDAGAAAEDITDGQNGYIVPLFDNGERFKQALYDTLRYFEHIKPGNEINFGAVNVHSFGEQAEKIALLLNRFGKSN